MNLIKKTVINALIAMTIYVVIWAFNSDDGFGLKSLGEALWPNAVMLGVFYGVVSYLISRFWRKES